LGFATLRYWLTFILCFGNERWYRRRIFYPLYGLAFFAALAVLSAKVPPHILIEIGVFCLAASAVVWFAMVNCESASRHPSFYRSFTLRLQREGHSARFL